MSPSSLPGLRGQNLRTGSQLAPSLAFLVGNSNSNTIEYFLFVITQDWQVWRNRQLQPLPLQAFCLSPEQTRVHLPCRLPSTLSHGQPLGQSSQPWCALLNFSHNFLMSLVLPPQALSHPYCAPVTSFPREGCRLNCAQVWWPFPGFFSPVKQSH